MRIRIFRYKPKTNRVGIDIQRAAVAGGLVSNVAQEEVVDIFAITLGLDLNFRTTITPERGGKEEKEKKRHRELDDGDILRLFMIKSMYTETWAGFSVRVRHSGAENLEYDKILAVGFEARVSRVG